MNWDQDSNFSISSRQQCVGWFEHAIYRNEEIKWVGFDKYGKLLYGIRKNFHAENRTYEIIMHSILGGEPRVIKSIQVEYPDGNDLAALSKGGEYICLWVDIDLHEENTWQNSLYLIHIENDIVNRYQLIPSIKNPEAIIESFFSSSTGWLCCVRYKHVNDDPPSYSFYRMIFDEFRKTVSFVIVTELVVTYIVSPPIICDGGVFIFSIFGDKLNVYDFRRQSWSFRRNERKSAKLFFIVSDDARNIFAVPEFDRPESSRYCLYKLLDNNNWGKVEASLNTLNSNEQLFETGLRTNNVVFLNRKMKKQLTMIVSFDNVLSLQDMVVKNICRYCKSRGISLYDFMTCAGETSSSFLLREYCGSAWMWNK